MNKVVCTLIVFAALFLFGMNAEAQCAMCKATAESATDHVNRGIGEGLNAGIVYLMVTPYLLLAVIGTIFFRKKIVALFRPHEA